MFLLKERRWERQGGKMEREGLEENPVGREKARLGVKNKCKKTDIGRDRGRWTSGGELSKPEAGCLKPVQFILSS